MSFKSVIFVYFRVNIGNTTKVISLKERIILLNKIGCIWFYKIDNYLKYYGVEKMNVKYLMEQIKKFVIIMCKEYIYWLN